MIETFTPNSAHSQPSASLGDELDTTEVKPADTSAPALKDRSNETRSPAVKRNLPDWMVDSKVSILGLQSFEFMFLQQHKF